MSKMQLDDTGNKEVILGSYEALEVGKTYKGIRRNIPGDNNYYPDIPYVVLREATIQEWIDNYELLFNEKVDKDSIKRAKVFKAKFYEVSTD